MMKAKNEDENDVPFRRRGRPTGKNRVPLSLEERRARNALYERERRNETADAMTQLAEAVGSDPNISNADLLATVISQIQRTKRNNSKETIDDIMRINLNLESQIAMLQDRLGLDDESFNQMDSEEFHCAEPHLSTNSIVKSYRDHEERSLKQTKKRKRFSSSESNNQEKRAKTRSETSVDSGVEMQRQSVSPTELCNSNNKQCLTPEQLQQPAEIIEENAVSHSYIDLQTELYRQIYNNPDGQTMQSASEGELSESPMESLKQSLITIPAIISPQKPPDLYLEQQPVSESPNLLNIEPYYDTNILNADNECEVLPKVETTLDFLTDSEKSLINDWLDGELLKTSEFNDQISMTSYDITSEI